LFVEPTAKALAPFGMRFVQHMVVKRRYSVFMGMTSTFTVLSGALLFWQRASGQWLEYVQTGPGLGITLGSAVGIFVYFIGMFGVKPRAERMAAIGQEIEKAGVPPTPEQGVELHKLDREMSTLGVADFLLVALSLALMATARLWIV
ncbi:MAG: hypothetical protein ACM3PY_02660, partial [Omnitrophica WOR_2 bacterium]